MEFGSMISKCWVKPGQSAQKKLAATANYAPLELPRNFRGCHGDALIHVLYKVREFMDLGLIFGLPSRRYINLTRCLQTRSCLCGVCVGVWVLS